MTERNQYHTRMEAFAGEFVTRSPEETFDLAEKIGESLDGATIFLLKGDLGAGKTLFAKGLAAGLDIDPVDVTSPTFTLINLYEGRLRMYHIDLYRLDEGMHNDLGLEEIFEEEAVILIEWAERLGYVPHAAITVEIEYVEDSERKINIAPPSV
jgi:tRNA threonylcarbamoyladenosine biosynthesis protein TsaE